MNALVIGAQNIDLYSRNHKKYNLHDSNEAKIHLAFGGVGRNIAANLNYMGNHVTFITIFGDDYFSQIAQASLNEAGIDISHSKIIDNQNNSIYLGIMDQKNDLFIGCNDMELLKFLDVTFLESKKDIIDSFDKIILDNNLGQKALEYIVLTYHTKTIVIDGVSAKKVLKLKHLLPNITYLKINQIELNTLSKKETITEQIKELLDLGLQNIIVTNQDQKIYFANKQQLITVNPKPIKHIISASGAGDAFLSGFVHGLIHNVDINQALEYAKNAAYITLSSKNAVSSSINKEKVEQI